MGRHSYGQSPRGRNLVTAPAWPAHPDWLAKFIEVLGAKIETLSLLKVFDKAASQICVGTLLQSKVLTNVSGTISNGVCDR